MLDVDGIPTHYERGGAGPEVLVLHGWGADSTSVQGITRSLADRFDVIAPDLPGFGGTGSPPGAWGSEDYARWVLHFLDALGIERASLVGHSNGGRISIQLASRHRERVDKVVLVDSSGLRTNEGAPPDFGARTREELRPTFDRLVQEDLRDLLPAMPPALLIWGELDDATPVVAGRTMEELIPGAALIVLEGANHFSYTDPRFVPIVRSFLLG